MLLPTNLYTNYCPGVSWLDSRVHSAHARFRRMRCPVSSQLFVCGFSFFFFSGNLSKQPSELELTKPILGLQPRDKAAMLVVKTKEIFLLNLHQNRVHFPAERNAFVLDHQHGRRDVTCKPAILWLSHGLVALAYMLIGQVCRLLFT